MKTIWLSLFLAVNGCALKSTDAQTKLRPEISVSPLDFPDSDSCFLLYNLKEQNFEKVFGDARCRVEISPNSTFKIPLAVMAIESGLIKDAKTPFKWNGTKHGILSWNQDQTAQSWLANSVVWVSQILTDKLGERAVQRYLDDFAYGNRDFSGGLQSAWLDSRLKITPFSQIQFLKKLWRNELPLPKHAQELTREMLYLAQGAHGERLSGKTGSGFVLKNRDQRAGWFVGHLSLSSGEEYLMVTEFADQHPKPGTGYGGPAARKITENILHRNGLW